MSSRPKESHVFNMCERLETADAAVGQNLYRRGLLRVALNALLPTFSFYCLTCSKLATSVFSAFSIKIVSYRTDVLNLNLKFHDMSRLWFSHC